MKQEQLFADLHIHTTNSDGTFNIENVPTVAKEEYNLSAIAITDHDTIQPTLNKPLTVINGIDVIHGIELRVEVPELGDRIDILGYGVEKTDELINLTEKIQENRKERARIMIERVENELDITLDIEPTKSTGRPHIARAIDENEDSGYSYNESFKYVIGNDCSCYLSRDVPEFNQGVQVLKNSCHSVVLAHPYRYENPSEALKLVSKLDGVECDYSYSNPPAKNNAYKTAQNSNKIKTGGSDAHEETLSKAGLTQKEYIEFLNKSGLYHLSENV